jgi:hypothetical protein
MSKTSASGLDPEAVHEQYPYQERTDALAISSETIQDHYNDWS